LIINIYKTKHKLGNGIKETKHRKFKLNTSSLDHAFAEKTPHTGKKHPLFF